MISEAVKEFERGIIARNMQSGKRINDFDKFVEFLMYAYRGKPICNGITGIYKPFVTIGISRDGYFENQFTWKKLSSKDEAEVLQWMFNNQERVGVIEHIEPYESRPIEQLPETPKQEKIENQKVCELVASVADIVKVGGVA